QLVRSGVGEGDGAGRERVHPDVDGGAVREAGAAGCVEAAGGAEVGGAGGATGRRGGGGEQLPKRPRRALPMSRRGGGVRRRVARVPRIRTEAPPVWTATRMSSRFFMKGRPRSRRGRTRPTAKPLMGLSAPAKMSSMRRLATMSVPRLKY